MDIYLAGAATGNNNWIWKRFQEEPEKAMEVFLSAPHSNEMKAAMDIYLAGSYSRPFVNEEPRKQEDALDKIFVLESFYYISDWMLPYIKNHWTFMLDSGAFTFMNSAGKSQIDWDEYLERYAEFVKKNDIKLFFELDIDSIVGIKEVERLRFKLEQITGKQSIPVWHKSRGLKYWDKMAENYDYISIGGIVSREIKKNEYHVFHELIRRAKRINPKVRIHGLGFTNIQGMKKYKFDSVDSTAWIYGNRGGFLYKFNGQEMTKIDKPKGKRLKARVAAIHNFTEWVKFQKYAKSNL